MNDTEDNTPTKTEKKMIHLKNPFKGVANGEIEARLKLSRLMLFTIILLITVGILIPYFNSNKQKEDEVYTAQQINEMDVRRINVNTATAEELMMLESIGEKRAEMIIAYREEFGDYTSVDRIKEIAGISDKAFRNIEIYLTAEPSK